MNRDHLEWINRAYSNLIEFQEIPKMELKVVGGKLSVYRVGDTIRIDIKTEETERKYDL